MDVLADGPGDDAVVFVELILDLPAAGGLVHGGAHGGGDMVGVQNDLALGVSGGSADGLNEGGLAAEEPFLVGVQNGYQRDLRHVQTLTQQVDAHQHVHRARAQIPDDLRPLDGLDVVVHIADLDARLLQVGRQVLRHFNGQGGDQNSLVALDAEVDLPQQVVDLPLNGPDLHHGVQQSGGADDLFHDLARAAALVLRRGGGDVDDLIHPLFKLRKF